MKGTNSILIVDDNVEFCTNLTDILQLEGYEVMSVHDGFKALGAFKDNSFDVVLMDIKMPVMNGVETLKKLKEVAPETQVIMMTAYAVEDLINEALREGAHGAFQKPLDFEKFFSCIEMALPDGALIMVVDDDKELCANLLDVLSEKGYRVKVATDGRSAVDVARQNRFDVILLDLKLPVMNGMETYVAIRDIRPDVVTILITGYRSDMSDSVHQALKRGVSVCLEKPLEMERLLALLEEFTESRSTGIVK